MRPYAYSLFVIVFIIIFFPISINAQQVNPLRKELSEFKPFNAGKLKYKGDWLVQKPEITSAIYQKNECLILSNGLISRTFSIFPDGATIGFDNLVKSVSLFRAVKPEAIVSINGHQLKVGGLKGQPVMNYFIDSWRESDLSTDENAMHLTDFVVNPIKAPFEWKKRLSWMSLDSDWPPKGLELTMIYRYEKDLVKSLQKQLGEKLAGSIEQIEVEIHYEMYDNLPLLSKWIVVKNNSSQDLRLDDFQSEILAYIEPESVVGDKETWKLPLISVETDYAFGGSMSQEASANNSFSWEIDEEYKTIINYSRIQPGVLVVSPKIGPGIDIKSGDSFTSYKVFELVHDNSDRERQGLALRKMYRTIAPWTTENPILMHVRRADDKSVKAAIDQCADVGFEMVIMTFGSGFNIEDSTESNWERLKQLGVYAHEREIALGGYSLLASRKIDAENDVIMPEGQMPRFNNSPCLHSTWGQKYFKNLYKFYDYTELDILEHDGSYPGDICMSTQHPGHRDVQDSQWKQFEMISDFYKWCRARGIYLNVPDWYFLNASNKTAMGYRETNWSLPRDYQEIIERQNIYDGTWEKTPSMGWVFVRLVQYHGGGKAATIEPLHEHLDHYEQRLANLFGAGVQACYRGPRLYDTPETREVVKKWVDFYLKHRRILDADIIHIRRPDGRDYDGLLHVDPEGDEKGLLMLYNPLDVPIKKQIEIDLYYTGIRNSVQMNKQDDDFVEVQLDDNYILNLEIEIPENKWTWYIFK
jgi:hypothetical protein